MNIIVIVPVILLLYAFQPVARQCGGATVFCRISPINTKTMQELMILVDPFGRRTGVAGRETCHRGGGMRHRAFVVFLYTDDGRLLVQKRAASKLGGNRWDVSATSHVRAGETYTAAIARCLQHELGIDTPVSCEYRLAYSYLNRLGDCAENEHCSLFLVNYQGAIRLNAAEMDEVRWLDVAELRQWFEGDEQQFTHWFAEAFRRMPAL